MVENFEKKIWCWDLLVDDEVLVVFYDECLLQDIVSGWYFESWWKNLFVDELKNLELIEEDIF